MCPIYVWSLVLPCKRPFEEKQSREGLGKVNNIILYWDMTCMTDIITPINLFVGELYVCQAYEEEEERRGAEERKRNEAQAISRWYQLLSSIVTRQRLNNRYGESVSSNTLDNMHKPNEEARARASCSENEMNKIQTHGPEHENRGSNKWDTVAPLSTNDHEHVYLKDDQTFDEESSIRTKRCRCGFSIQVEEL